ncbi:MAG: hypothetical protein NTV34_11325 [Proteobacteria bacterium]|nr:hypothetical protein [Pseudomonadota bacterium]
MSADTRRKLFIVKFNPSDYSLGDILVRDNTCELDDHSKISAAFSLYLQWPTHRRAIIYLGSNSESQQDCTMSVDLDDREPSHIFIKTIDEPSRDLRSLDKKNLVIRFEVFRSCYQFSAEIIDTFSYDGEVTHVVEIPKTLTFIKSRRLPRSKIDLTNAHLAPRVNWKCAVSETSDQLILKEISMLSLAAETEADLPLGKGTIVYKGHRIPGEIVRRKGNQVIVSIQCETPEHVGSIFDLYRLVAYPYLRDRSEFPLSVAVSLLKNTGYLSKYKSEEALRRSEVKIEESWGELTSCRNGFTADYYIVNEAGLPTGMSSTALAYKCREKDIWSFHQLCAMTDPSVLEHSGALYTWRAEYLAGRPEDFCVFSRYTSKSRWLERIYTKFSGGESLDVRLQAVKSFQISASAVKSSGTKTVQTRRIPYGDSYRIVAECEGAVGGAYPGLLNAADNLDAALAFDGPTDNDSVLAVAEAIFKESEGSLDKIFLTFNDYEALVPEGSHESKIDRIIFFSKSSLADFIGCVEHSIAVTRRKLSNES